MIYSEKDICNSSISIILFCQWQFLRYFYFLDYIQRFSLSKLIILRSTKYKALQSIFKQYGKQIEIDVATENLGTAKNLPTETFYLRKKENVEHMYQIFSELK